MTFDELVDMLTWDTIEGITRGNKLRDIVWISADVAIRWRQEQDRKKAVTYKYVLHHKYGDDYNEVVGEFDSLAMAVNHAHNYFNSGLNGICLLVDVPYMFKYPSAKKYTTVLIEQVESGI